MITKIVCRLLDTENALLGWCEVQAKARGDGKLWSQGPVVIVAERAGWSAHVSIHWVDINVEIRHEVIQSVLPGQPVTIYQQPCPLITVGPMPGPLPAVTVGSVAVGIPVGQMGAHGYR